MRRAPRRISGHSALRKALCSQAFLRSAGRMLLHIAFCSFYKASFSLMQSPQTHPRRSQHLGNYFYGRSRGVGEKKRRGGAFPAVLPRVRLRRPVPPSPTAPPCVHTHLRTVLVKPTPNLCCKLEEESLGFICHGIYFQFSPRA